MLRTLRRRGRSHDGPRRERRRRAGARGDGRRSHSAEEERLQPLMISTTFGEEDSGEFYVGNQRFVRAVPVSAGAVNNNESSSPLPLPLSNSTGGVVERRRRRRAGDDTTNMDNAVVSAPPPSIPAANSSHLNNSSNPSQQARSSPPRVRMPRFRGRNTNTTTTTAPRQPQPEPEAVPQDPFLAAELNPRVQDFLMDVYRGTPVLRALQAVEEASPEEFDTRQLTTRRRRANPTNSSSNNNNNSNRPQQETRAELEARIREELEIELHPKFQQALLEIHKERFEQRQLERAIASSEQQYDNDEDDDSCSVATTAEGRNNLRSFLQTQGISLTPHQTQSLAQMLVRRESLVASSQQQQQANSSVPVRNRGVIGEETANQTSPPRPRPREITPGLPPRNARRRAPPRSRSNSPNHHQNTNNSSSPVPQYLNHGPTTIPRRQGARAISSHDDQSVVSSLTVPSEFHHGGGDAGEEPPSDPEQQRDSIQTSIPIEAQDQQSQESNGSVMSRNSGDEVASRFSEEDYMDDEQLDLYVLQLGAADEPKTASATQANKSSSSSKTGGGEPLSDFLLAQQMAVSELEEQNNHKKLSAEKNNNNSPSQNTRNNDQDTVTARPSLASLDGINILDHISAASVSSGQHQQAQAQNIPLKRRTSRSRGLQEDDDYESAVQANQPPQQSPRWTSNNRKTLSTHSLDVSSKSSDVSSSAVMTDNNQWLSSPSSSERTPGSTSLTSSTISQSTTALHTQFFCPMCRQSKPTKGHSFACDNITSPHLVCSTCAQDHLRRSMDGQQHLDAEPRTIPVPCWLGDSDSCPCTGHMYIRL